MDSINLAKNPAPIALLVAALKPNWNYKGLLLDTGFGVPTCAENDAYYANCDINDVYNSGLNIVEGQFLVYNGSAFEIQNLVIESGGTNPLPSVSEWRSAPTVVWPALNNHVELFRYVIADSDRDIAPHLTSSSSGSSAQYGYFGLANANSFCLEMLLHPLTHEIAEIMYPLRAVINLSPKFSNDFLDGQTRMIGYTCIITAVGTAITNGDSFAVDNLKHEVLDSVSFSFENDNTVDGGTLAMFRLAGDGTDMAGQGDIALKLSLYCNSNTEEVYVVGELYNSYAAAPSLTAADFSIHITQKDLL